MPRNGNSAVATKEPNDTYDELSLDEQGHWDAIGAAGYTPERSGANWTANSQIGDNQIGPVANLIDLLGKINGDDEADHPDGVLFEEMRPKNQIVVPELRNPILNYRGFTEERLQVLAKEVEAKGIVDTLMHQYKDKLAFDPKTGISSYRVNDIVVELVPGKETIKSRREEEEEG